MYIEVPVGASVQLQNLNFSAKWTPWSYSRGLVDAGRRKKYIDIYINKVCAGARTFFDRFRIFRFSLFMYIPGSLTGGGFEFLILFFFHVMEGTRAVLVCVWVPS